MTEDRNPLFPFTNIGCAWMAASVALVGAIVSGIVWAILYL